MTFRDRYGPWAVVAGASMGLGAAFAEELAGRGLNLVLIARGGGPLETVALRLRPRVSVTTIAGDIAEPQTLDRLTDETLGKEVGLVVANAAYSPIGPFLSKPADDLVKAVDVNCVAPLRLACHFLPAMVARHRGGLILMSSLAGVQGSPGIATYAATKAFLAVLAEGLWGELAPEGVDIVGCLAGAVATPGYQQATTRRAPGTLEAPTVARAALDALGHGPRVVPGAVNRLAVTVMSRLLPRRLAVRIMRSQTARVTAPGSS